MYKYVMTFIGGAVVGAAGILLWLRKDYNKKIEEAVTEHEQKAAEAKKEAEQAKKELESEKKNADVRLQNELSRRLGYTGDAAEVMTRKADRRDSRASERHSESNVGSLPEPYGISGDDFLYDNKEFSKITLMYYKGDGVLATEDGTPVEDVRIVLGNSWKDEIGKYDDDVAYIRNEKAGSDYEVVCEDLEYAQVYGDEAPD